MKEKRLTLKDVEQIVRLRDKIEFINTRLVNEGRNHSLEGNGNVSEQLSCACACLDCILQEYFL